MVLVQFERIPRYVRRVASITLAECERALRLMEEVSRAHGDEPAVDSVIAQLHYLISLQLGHEQDRSRRRELTLGRLAVDELSGIISDDLSKLLCSISDGVRRQLRAEDRR